MYSAARASPSAWQPGVALGVGFALGVDVKAWTILVTIAAVATELMFWCIAATLGLTVFEARRRIWRGITSPFGKRVGDGSQSKS